jgi:hypothetical protein
MRKPKRVTLDDVLKWGPCYSRLKLRELAGSRKTITAEGILQLPIPHNDKLWAVLREDFFSKRELHLLAADFAEHTLHIFERNYPNDQRPRKCLAVVRRYANGEAAEVERAAAGAAAWDAARDWQIAKIGEYLTEE